MSDLREQGQLLNVVKQDVEDFCSKVTTDVREVKNTNGAMKG